MKRVLLLLGIMGAAANGQCNNTGMTHPRAVAAAARVRSALERDLAAAGLRFGDPVFIRAFKEERRLELFVRNRGTGKPDLFRSYVIAAASGKPGPKLAEGDGQVPEGFYHLPPSARKPDSTYHLAFNIGYHFSE